MSWDARRLTSITMLRGLGALSALIGLSSAILTCRQRSNRSTLDNIRLWDWRALQDTLTQIQAIRTYYDFTDVDVDRYTLGGQKRQMMLGTRELNVAKLPPSSSNWVNEKLIYTH